MIARALAWILAVVSAGGGLLALRSNPPREPAPALTCACADGEHVALDDLRGRRRLAARAQLFEPHDVAAALGTPDGEELDEDAPQSTG